MKKALCAAVASLLMASCFAGCGDKSEDKKSSSDFLGKWECQYVSTNNVKMEQFMGVPISAIAQLEVKNDGTYSITSAVASMNTYNSTGSWKAVDSDTIEFNMNNNKGVCDLKGGQLVMNRTESGFTVEMAFSRVTEFSTYNGSLNAGDMLSGLNIDGLNLDGIDLSGIDLSGLMQ